MIKIIAIADLHLGFQFHSMLETKEQTDNYLAWLKQRICEKEPDVLLMAGDIFDSGNPAAETLKDFYRFLVDIKREREEMRVFVIAGNHDSALKMEMTAPFTDIMGVDIIGKVRRDEEGKIDYSRLVFSVDKGGEKAHIVCVPYLREGSFDRCEGGWKESVERFYEQAVCEAETKKRDDNESVVVMGHLYLEGAKRKNEDDNVGGIDSVSLNSIEEKISLGVFGHIHREQWIGKSGKMRYVGSSVPQSFDEEEYQHGADYYEIEGCELKRFERLGCAPYHKLMTISREKKNIDEVIAELKKTLPAKKSGGKPSIYLRVRYFMDEYCPSAKLKIDEAVEDKNAVVCVYNFMCEAERESVEDVADIDDMMEKISPMDMLKERYRICHKGEMSAEVEELANMVIREAEG